jgi:transcriptional regulator with XRE-family HTH domain
LSAPESAVKTPADFPAALVAVRRAKSLHQHHVAAELGLSVRTLVRWENGLSRPGVVQRESLVAWLRTLTGPEVERALVALGTVVTRTGGAPAPLSPEDAKRAAMVVENALFKAAEQGEVPARAARAIAVAVLEACDSTGLTPKRARELLAK